MMLQPLHPAPSNAPLPARQGAALAFIDDYLEQQGRFPSAEEIAVHMGWRDVHSVHDCLFRLTWRGYLLRDRKHNGRKYQYHYERIDPPRPL